MEETSEQRTLTATVNQEVVNNRKRKLIDVHAVTGAGYITTC